MSLPEKMASCCNNISDKKLDTIISKVLNFQRISLNEAFYLYTHAELPLMGYLSNKIREFKNGNNTYYIKNIHLEYTNLCINKCAFCSFRSKTKEDSWELSAEGIMSIIKENASSINEVHIVGGIHPEKDLNFWLPVLRSIKDTYPTLHIKAFTAAELDFLISKAGYALKKGLALLKDNGLDSIPGGGAEIFDEDCRKKLFPTKISAKKWLAIHKAAHKINIPSNATMLYGHIETISQRLKHLDILRNLQDNTNGFNAFIPLKFKSRNNALSYIKESSIIEDLKVFAVSRIYLDNFQHIKAYWPMLGKDTAFLALDFGVDDMDGTINNTTSIYSRAGATDQKPQMSETEFKDMIKVHRRIPVERNAVYDAVIKGN
ncbi:MAG: CofH family radical SAM protein [Bacteroidales bacterium]|nr:CofH family radical SAM protein [Bacteroidales bacterium]